MPKHKNNFKAQPSAWNGRFWKVEKWGIKQEQIKTFRGSKIAEEIRRAHPRERFTASFEENCCRALEPYHGKDF